MKIRNIIIAIIGIAVMLPALQSCKKGENDPAISLKSRTARLSGEWTVSKASIISTSGGVTTTTTYNGSTVTITYSDGSTGSTGTFTWTFSIDKNGTYTEEISETYTGITESRKTEGAWNWADGNKDAEIKAKEMVLFHQTKNTYTSGSSTTVYSYTGLNYDGWMVDKLSSKEVVLKYKNVYTSTGTSTTTREITLVK